MLFRFSGNFPACLENFQVIKSFPGCLKNFEVVHKLSMSSGNFPVCLESFLVFWKIKGRLETFYVVRNFPGCLKIFQVVWKLSKVEISYSKGWFYRNAQKLANMQYLQTRFYCVCWGSTRTLLVLYNFLICLVHLLDHTPLHPLPPSPLLKLVRSPIS